MDFISKRINEIKQNGYDIDLGNLINESFENYKKIALLAGLGMLIVILSLLIVAVFGMSYFVDFENLSEESLKMDFATFTPIQIASYIGGISFIAMLLAPFTAGLIKISYDVETQDEISFSTLFDCYSADYLKELLLSSLLISLISSSITVGFQIIHLEFIGTLLTYLISFLLCLSIPLIIFGKLPALKAIIGSVLIVSKQPIIIGMALILAAIISFTGFFGFCIGIFFTLPYLYCMHYAIYKQSVGFENEHRNSNI